MINVFLALIIGVCIGFIFCSILWLKQNSDDMVKLDIEIARIQDEIAGLKSELAALEEQDNGNDD